MFCATCGTLIDTKLNYCNRCGAKLSKKEEGDENSPKSILDNLLTALSRNFEKIPLRKN